MKISWWVVLFSACVVPSVHAATLEWDRNSESDMKDYQIWVCLTPNCIVTKSPSLLVATVPQTAVGVRPSTTIDINGKEGSIAASARDQSLNESGLSVPLPFDVKAPAIPANLGLN